MPATTDDPSRPPAPATLDYLTGLVARWRLFVVLPGLTAISAIAISFAMPKIWAAKVVFLPVSSGGSGVGSALSSLAGQFGVNVPGEAAGDSPEFYVALTKSREILDQILVTAFPDPDGGARRPLIDVLGIEGSSDAERAEKGREALKLMVSAQSDRVTKVVSITVRAEAPRLAAEIANQFVVLMNRFNLERRGVQAGASRRFIEGRLTEAEQDLRVAEDALRYFRTRNRQIVTPELQFEDGRLQRQVQLRQEVYLGLRRDYEAVRIQEVNTTPLIAVIDSASAPVKRSSPARGRMAVLAFVFGVGLAAAVAIAQAVVADLERTGEPGWLRLRAAWRTALQEIRAALKRRPPAEP